MKGQMDFEQYLSSRDGIFPSCSTCVCENCLYRWSSRCQHGECYDGKRAKETPYDKVHPDKTPRKQWSNWNKPGEQAHWCRGGIFYPVHYCKNFVKFEGESVEECISCNISVFQDGYISCTYKKMMGCEACVNQKGIQERIERYGCQYMTETGCEAHINALTMMAQAILQDGEEQFKNDPNLYIPRKLYFCINPQSCLFRSSHVIKLNQDLMEAIDE